MEVNAGAAARSEACRLLRQVNHQLERVKSPFASCANRSPPRWAPLLVRVASQLPSLLLFASHSPSPVRARLDASSGLQQCTAALLIRFEHALNTQAAPFGRGSLWQHALQSDRSLPPDRSLVAQNVPQRTIASLSRERERSAVSLHSHPRLTEKPSLPLRQKSQRRQQQQQQQQHCLDKSHRALSHATQLASPCHRALGMGTNALSPSLLAPGIRFAPRCSLRSLPRPTSSLPRSLPVSMGRGRSRTQEGDRVAGAKRDRSPSRNAASPSSAHRSSRALKTSNLCNLARSA